MSASSLGVAGETVDIDFPSVSGQPEQMEHRAPSQVRMFVAANTSALTRVNLPAQHFSGNPLTRSSDAVQRFEGRAATSDEVSLVVVAGREVCVRDASGTASSSSADASGLQDLQALLLGASDPELDLNSDTICLHWMNGDVPHQLPLYLLGLDKNERWTFALDISEVKPAFLAFLQETCQLQVLLADLRSLLPSLSRDATAIAGQAVALSQWHQSHRFCQRCGAATISSETGLRRRCIEHVTHKTYPRTDPVVIMLVESPDGSRALLGRNHQFTAGMYTCLSGFIDQCESIEEAVRREVYEEARVEVDDVQIAGTQPWPIGRAGSCELMLGCFAKARSYEVFVNTREMQDVQWYSREELRSAVGAYQDATEAASSIADVQARSMEEVGFFIPPPLAIAYHLISLWASQDTAWFAPKNQPPREPAPPNKL